MSSSPQVTLPTFSEQQHSTLFGIGYDMKTHSEVFRAVECFYAVRRETEKQRTRLVSLTVHQFKKANTAFRENIIKGLTDELYRRLLLPLVIDNPTTAGVNDFILACFVLSLNRARSLQQHGLVDIFPKLFSGIVGAINFLPGTLSAIDTFIKDICTETEHPSSDKLLG